MLRRHVGLIAFVALYLVGFTAYALAQGNSEFVFYAIVMVILIAGALAVHVRVRFSTPVLWLLAVWGLLHMAGGNVPISAGLALDWTPPAPGARTVLYNLRPFDWLPKFDQVVHTYGFFSATLASFEALRASIRSMKPGEFRASAGIALASFLMGMGLGALNEVVEFAATRFMDTNVGGYVNTGWDLVSNMTGAGIAAVLINYGRSAPSAAPA